MDYNITCSPYLLKFVPKKFECDKETLIYAFDLDDTLITTKSGNTHGKDNNDWKWLPNTNNGEDEYKNMFSLALKLLKNNKKSKLVIFTNQGGIKPFNKGYLKNNVAKVKKSHADHIENRFKVFILKLLDILNHFHNVLKEDRVLVYASIKTPLGIVKKQDPKVSQRSQLQLNKIFKVKKSASIMGSEKKTSVITSQITEEYYHDIPDHFLEIGTAKTIVSFQHYEKLSKKKLENHFNCLEYRKPRIGMLSELYADFESKVSNVNIKFYAGDAAGRPKDFSDSDKIFAENGKLLFKTPEEIFLEYKDI
ncbi:hypothetical protein QEN19_000651 [Hanseniaspora menglaensis]